MRQALASLPGVANIETDVTTKTATISIDAAKFDLEQAIQALSDKGYDGSEVLKESSTDEPESDESPESGAIGDS